MGRAALKNILSTATKKKPKKRALSVATLKLGGEPVLNAPTKIELIKALSWFKACVTDRNAHKAWLLEYIEGRFPANIKKSVSDNARSLIPTHGFLARLLTTGVNMPPELYKRLDTYITEFAASVHDDTDFDEEGNPIIKEPVRRVRTNVAPMVEFIEDQIETVIAGKAPENVYTKLQNMGCNGATAVQLKNIFKFQTDEFIELSKHYTCDDELLEAYSHLRQPTKKKLGEFMKQLNEDLSSFAKVVKATRKPRKKKPVKVEKLVARVKYKAKDDTYKIASLTPDRIIGASWLWTFNTKYRIIAWYEADAGGLGIKGTTVTNFKKSGQKKLRKPEQQLAGFTSGAVKALPRSFDAIKTTEVEAVGRINADTIILRVF